MARRTTRAAMAGVAAAAVLLSACGQPPANIDPAAAPAPPVAVEPDQPAPVEPTTEPTPEATETPASTQPTPTPAPTRSQTPRPTTSPTARATPTRTQRPAGPAILAQGTQSDRVKELQARLAQIGWFRAKVTGYYGSATKASVAGFQGKRGLASTGTVDQATWDALVGMTKKPTAEQLADKPAPAPSRSGAAGGQRKAQGLDRRCMTGRVVCISKKSNKVWWVNDGVVKMTMDARFGTTEYRTREGTFSVQWKSRDHVSTIYHTSMPYALFFSGGQAVHFSPDFAARGYNGGSHGCVNLRDKGGAQALFNAARVGDKVVVYS